MFKDLEAFSGFSVTNMNEAKKFYGETLGLELNETPEGISLKLNGTTVFLYEKTDHVPANFTVLNFKVSSIDDAVDELVTKQVKLEIYNNMLAVQDEKGILRGKAAGYGPDIAWFKDPAGNILSVLET